MGMSPDGATFALAEGGHADIPIHLISLLGGADRDLNVKEWPNVDGLDFSADGKGFRCRSISPEGDTLLYIDLQGRARVLWRGPSALGIASPDGRYLALWNRVRNSNVRMLEGF